MEVKGPDRMPPRRLPGLGLPVDLPPTADDPLDVGRGARPPHGQEASFGLRRRHAAQRPDLGVGELPAGQGLGQERQCSKSARHPDPLAGRAQVEPHSPGEPGRTGAEARVPSSSGIELPDQGEQARGGGVEVCRKLGDLVAEPVQLRGTSGSHRRRSDRHGKPSFSCIDPTPCFSGSRRASGRGDPGRRNDF